MNILEKDAKHFNLRKEKLCNDILINLSLKEIKGVERELFDEKANLQFSLTQTNCEYYKIVSKNIDNEANYLRNIFTYYAHLNPFYREIMLNREKLIAVNNYLEKKEIINVSIGNRVDQLQIIEISRCHMTDYIKLKTDKGEFYMNELRMIF